MTPTDALAAALRERLVDGRPAPLPGLGTLVRRHVSARVEERPDGTRVLLPPGETIRLDADDDSAAPIAEAVGRHQGVPAAQAETALAEAMEAVEAALASSGEARLRGVGLLRRTTGGVVLGVEAGLLETVNRAYEGLPAIPTRPAPGGAAEPEVAEPGVAEPGVAEGGAEAPDAEGDSEEPQDEPTTPPAAESPLPGGEGQGEGTARGDQPLPPDAEEPDAEEPDAEEPGGVDTLPDAHAEDEPSALDAEDPETLPEDLAIDDLLPHPTDEDAADAGGAAEPDDHGSLAPSAPPLPSTFTEYESDFFGTTADPALPPGAEIPDEDETGGAADEALAAPFGAPSDPPLSDALPPTPPDRDPAFRAPTYEDDFFGVGRSNTLGEAEPEVPEESVPEESASAEPAPEDSAPEEPSTADLDTPAPEEVAADTPDATPGDATPDNETSDDDWMSNTWAAPGATPPPPTLGDEPSPTYEEAEVLDDGSSTAAPVDAAALAPDVAGPGADLPTDDIADLAVPAEDPPLDIVPPPVEATPRERRVPVDRVGPPVARPAAPAVAKQPLTDSPIEPRRVDVARDRLVESVESQRVASESQATRWWVALAALVLLGVVALIWWAVTRPDPETAAPTAAGPEAVEDPEVISAQPPDDLLAPSTADDALSGPDDDPPAEPDAEAAPPAAAGQPPRVPGGEGTGPNAAPPAGDADGVANLPPPTLTGLSDDDRATLTGGALDVDDRDTWTFVVASLQARADAAEVRQRYRDAGYKTAVLPLAGGFHRVGVGQFRSKAQADRLRDRLPPQAPPDTWVLSLRDL